MTHGRWYWLLLGSTTAGWLGGCAEGTASRDVQGGAPGAGGQDTTSQGGQGATAGDEQGALDDPDYEDSYYPVALAEPDETPGTRYAHATSLAPTPPMGWNSWNEYHCNIDQDLIRATADAMVDSGMRDVGYQYVNIDDCWLEAERDEEGRLQPTEAFSEGIAALADYVHERGLKLGIYADRGNETCGHRAGSEDHEAVDAATFAAWGVDYLKYDNCCSPSPTCYGGSGGDAEIYQPRYELMAEELGQVAENGHGLVLSVCAWQFYEWAVGLGHLWRTTSDIEATWDSIADNIATNQRWAAYAGPNAWNDPDMLEVGVRMGSRTMTENEYRAHFAMWAMMAAPLVAGNDLTDMDSLTQEILTNEELIAVDQDALGLQGAIVRKDEDLSVWAKPLNQAGAVAVALLNEQPACEDAEDDDPCGPAEITAQFAEVGLWAGAAEVRDLWAHEDLGTFTGSFTATVPPHAATVVKIVGAGPSLPRGTQYLSDLTWIYAANGLGPVERDTAVGASRRGDGDALSIDGITYEKGLGVGAPARVVYRLGRRCSRFAASIGLDDATDGQGSVVFHVLGDEETLFESDVVTGGAGGQTIDVDVTDQHRLTLLVTNAHDGTSWDRADWADARVECEE